MDFQFNHEINLDVDLMTIEDFYEEVKSGSFNDYDGHGYASDGKMYDGNFQIYPSDIAVWRISKPEFSYIAWFNK